jgi:hypothetical protein
MCDDCFTEEDAQIADEVAPAITPGLLATMRAIEADLPGEPAGDAAWAVFLGQATGMLGWNDLRRLAQARTAAAALNRMGAAV